MRTLTPLESELFEEGRLPCDVCRAVPATAVWSEHATCDNCEPQPDPREMGWAAEARAEAMGWNDGPPYDAATATGMYDAW